MLALAKKPFGKTTNEQTALEWPDKEEFKLLSPVFQT
jgi:hypothetical protein